jgi:hypothetical protein
VVAGVWAAGLCLVIGLLVLVVSPTNPAPVGHLAAASSQTTADRAKDRAAAGHDGDRKAGRIGADSAGRGATSILDGARPGGRAGSGHRSGTGGRGHRSSGKASSGRRSRSRSHPSLQVASFTGYGDLTTRQFNLSGTADWQIAWSYSCPASLPVGLLIVEDAAPGAIGAAINESGAAGQGDTWFNPDGRSHRLVVISTCSWTMKVIQSS